VTVDDVASRRRRLTTISEDDVAKWLGLGELSELDPNKKYHLRLVTGEPKMMSDRYEVPGHQEFIQGWRAAARERHPAVQWANKELIELWQRALEHVKADHQVLRAIWNLHQPREYGGIMECVLDYDAWPCETIRAYSCEAQPLE
jgi:hypothetical protein